MTNTIRLNDVDLDSVGALIAQINDTPEAADTTWKANVTWDGAFRSTARIREFEPIASDEPAGLGGDDTAPNPVEQLLAALGNCLVVGYAANASARGIQLDRLDIELSGDLDLRTFLGLDDGHAGYSAIRASVSIESPATPEAIDSLHETVLSTSPVGHTLARPVEVAVELART